MRTRLLIVLLLLCLPWGAFSRSPADSLLKVLRVEIGRKRVYDNRKEKEIAALRQEFKAGSRYNLAKAYQSADALFDIYRDYRFDSTFYYAQRLIDISRKLKDPHKTTDNQLRLANTLVTSGMFKETFDCLHGINPRMLDKGLKKFYYILMSWAWSDLSNYNADRFYAPDNLEKKFRYLDSAIALTDAGSFEQLILQAQRKPGNGRSLVGYYLKLQQKGHLSPHEEAMVATGLSQYRTGNEKIRLLAIAAINDVRTSTYRAQAVFDLSKALFAAGRVDDAYFFVQQAMDQANRFGARTQRYEVTRLLSEISAKRDVMAERQRHRFSIIMFMIIAVAVITGLVCFIIFVQLKRVRAGERVILENNRLLADTNHKLWEEGRIKEEYIGYFFGELSRHILKLDKLKNNVHRKARSGNADEIVRLLDSVDINAERSQLYHTFDKIFLKLFPDFVDVLNTMLREEDRLKPKTPGTLTAQLRIFALVRLGIDNNDAIAAILEYSVNTVYTYRFRLRSKALVPADEFENRIMGIRLLPD